MWMVLLLVVGAAPLPAGERNSDGAQEQENPVIEAAVQAWSTRRIGPIVRSTRSGDLTPRDWVRALTVSSLQPIADVAPGAPGSGILVGLSDLARAGFTSAGADETEATRLLLRGLGEALSGDNPEATGRAALVLGTGRLGAPIANELVRRMKALAESRDRNSLAAISELCGGLGPILSGLQPTLKSLVTSPDPAVRYYAAFCLLSLGVYADPEQRELVQSMSDSAREAVKKGDLPASVLGIQPAEIASMTEARLQSLIPWNMGSGQNTSDDRRFYVTDALPVVEQSEIAMRQVLLLDAGGAFSLWLQEASPFSVHEGSKLLGGKWAQEGQVITCSPVLQDGGTSKAASLEYRAEGESLVATRTGLRFELVQRRAVR